MLTSMTGFATREIELKLPSGRLIGLSINLKSFNSRFLEVTCKLPAPLQHLEGELTAMLRGRLVRGHVYLVMHMDSLGSLKGNVKPSMRIIGEYLKAANEVREKLGVEGSLSISDIVKLPYVFDTEEESVGKDSDQTITESVKTLLEKLVDTQQQEGNTIQADLHQRAKNIETSMENVSRLSKEAVEQCKAKFGKEIEEALSRNEELEDVKKNILYSTLDKIDTHEEITRLIAHLETFTKKIDSDGREKGKHLDFLAQEMMREINTISAKCSDATIGTIGISIRVELEKIREQVQNVA